MMQSDYGNSSPLIGLNTCTTCPEVGYYPDGLGAQSVLLAEGSMSLNFTGTSSPLQLLFLTSSFSEGIYHVREHH